MRRVVVTGLGMVTPLGCGVDAHVAASHRGAKRRDARRAIRRVRSAVPDRRPDPARRRLCRHLQSRSVDGAEGAAQGRRVHHLCNVRSASQALDDAGWKPQSYEDQIATGVLIGSGIGGVGRHRRHRDLAEGTGPRRVSPFFIPGRIINLASGYVSIEYGLKGPNHAVVTACSTGSHAIGDAGRMIALGDADVMVAGGAKSPINRVSMAGFAAARALSTSFNDTPERASRPYDRDRDGFVMGEGAGAVVLEEYEHAKKRGAKIYAELVGYGISGDAFTSLRRRPDGDGAFRCMNAAIKRAGITPADIDYINAHGTSTPLGDEIELGAVQRLVGNAAGQICACPRPSLRLGTCWARRARSRRSSGFWRSAIRSRRRPSISTIRRSRRRSISCRIRPASARSMSRCPIRSASAAPMRRWCSEKLGTKWQAPQASPKFAIFGNTLEVSGGGIESASPDGFR